jgi:hypothetical protein
MKHFPGIALVLTASALTAGAQYQVDYTIAPSGPNYTYTYSVWNNSANPLSDLLIYFPDVSSADAFSYSLLSSVQPAGWTGVLVPPSSPDLGGFVEFAASGAGLASGGSLGGFSVTFNYSGAERLGSQFFEVYDPQFNLLGAGFTVPRGPVGVPDEFHWATWLIALAGLGLCARHRAPSLRFAPARF